MDFKSYIPVARRYHHRPFLRQVYILLDDYGLDHFQIAEICCIKPSNLRRIMRSVYMCSVDRYMYMSHFICEYWRLHSSVQKS